MIYCGLYLSLIVSIEQSLHIFHKTLLVKALVRYTCSRAAVSLIKSIVGAKDESRDRIAGQQNVAILQERKAGTAGSGKPLIKLK